MTEPLDPRYACAVVGMACRLPGADDPRALWDLLRNRGDASGEIPGDRYDGDHYRADEPTPGKLATTRGSFLADAAGFDAGFFGLDEVQAMWLDPQQRLLLMCAWDALEDAGIPPSSVRGARGAIYVGNNRLDYLYEQMFVPEEDYKPLTLLNGASLMSGRLAHVLDWRGPNMYLDTGCSATLVAVHQACQALRTGDATIALATGVNLKLRPAEDIVMSNLGMIAKDGRCKFGDASADGWTPSDGAGAILLKRLDQAIADGDRIRAIVRGSAVTSDGASSGQMLRPSIDGQLQTLQWAYESAGVNPADVDFVEAHGTGTRMIDPIELTAFGQFFGEGRTPQTPLLIGSVKTNVGHAEAASGIASMVKSVLALEHRTVPATIHHANPTPSVAWDELPIRVPTEEHPLPERERPLIAGLGGQGISCVNAHIVLQEAPARPAPTPDDGAPRLLLLSARDPQALAELRAAHAAWLAPGGAGEASTLRDHCASAAARRDHHAHRWAAVAASVEELRDLLLDGGDGIHDLDEAGGDAHRDPLRLIAADYLAGAEFDAALITEAGGWAELPPYPWQLERHWIRPDAPVAPVTSEVLAQS